MAETKINKFHDDEDDDKIFYKRKSVMLTPENAHFYKSKGNLISLTLKNEDGTVEDFERVVALRSFPISDPDYYISIREPDLRNKEKGAEIGLIHTLADFDEETVKIINEELSLRYFSPQITKIYALKEKLGYIYCDADTTSGRFSFSLSGASNNIHTLEDGRVFIHDIDGNCFEIPDPSKLDKSSYKKIEIYL